MNLIILIRVEWWERSLCYKLKCFFLFGYMRKETENKWEDRLGRCSCTITGVSKPLLALTFVRMSAPTIPSGDGQITPCHLVNHNEEVWETKSFVNTIYQHNLYQ
jgi:hypothetical protein